MQTDSEHKMPIASLRVDGGMTANSLLMQFLSDLLNVPLVRPKVAETTALGAAFMAGLGVGLWRDVEDLKTLWQPDKTWHPTMQAPLRESMVRVDVAYNLLFCLFLAIFVLIIFLWTLHEQLTNLLL